MTALNLLCLPYSGASAMVYSRWRRSLPQWLQVRQIKPDWVILRGWGVMNPVALKSAQKVGYPADHIIGNIWSNSEEDVVPAGAAAKGFISITTHPSGTDFPVLQGIKQSVVDAGKGNLADPKRFGTVYYNLGVVNGIQELGNVVGPLYGAAVLTFTFVSVRNYAPDHVELGDVETVLADPQHPCRLPGFR